VCYCQHTSASECASRTSIGPMLCRIYCAIYLAMHVMLCASCAKFVVRHWRGSCDLNGSMLRACAKSGSTEGYQACVSGLGASLRRLTMRIVGLSKLVRHLFSHGLRLYHFCDSNLQPPSIAFCYCFYRGSTVLSHHVGRKKNDVAKMRQAGTAPATGTTIYCLTSL